jgi:hypothetical protein
VQWPEPRRTATLAQPPRRHYLRVTAEPHPGLQRKLESLLRRGGLTVQNHASRGEPLVTHHGFVISASDDTKLAAVVDQVRELGRVEQTLWLGISE